MGIVKEKNVFLWVFYKDGDFEKISQYDLDQKKKHQKENIKTWLFI